jgi:Ca2+-binding EF-hand superfamily protein
MNSKLKIWLAAGASVATAAAIVAGAAHADRGRHGMSNVSALMERYDANRDGALSQEEIDTNRTQWHGEFDKDKSGDLALAEFEALWLKARREMMVREFQEFDRDGDGKLTLDEYKAPLNAMVSRLDRNGDGLINRDDRLRRGRDDDDERSGSGSSN